MTLTVWRICAAQYAATAFSGEGARLYGGRWNPKGVRMVYCSSSLSLAMLEAFVHFAPATSPIVPQVALRATLADGAAIERLDRAKLPTDWRRYPAPAALALLGMEWLQSARSLALLVPSAVTPIDDPVVENVLLNPLHPDMAAVSIGPPQPFSFDPRMFK